MWHYPPTSEKAADVSSERRKEKPYSWKQKYQSYVLCPNIFIIDFDHTLAVYDSDRTLDPFGKSASVYTRPFMVEFLQYLKVINKNNILILWSRGKQYYISKMLLLLGICNYFNHILTRHDCNNSYRKYGCYKSFKYIVDKYPRYMNMRSFLIDDLALKNGGDDYFKLVSVKPFNLTDIEAGLDSTLLNVMLFLDQSFFNTTTSSTPPDKCVLTLAGDKLRLEKRTDVSGCDVFVKGWASKM